MTVEEVRHLAAGTHAVFFSEVDPDYDYRRGRELKIIQLLAEIFLLKYEGVH